MSVCFSSNIFVEIILLTNVQLLSEVIKEKVIKFSIPITNNKLNNDQLRSIISSLSSAWLFFLILYLQTSLHMDVVNLLYINKDDNIHK